MQIQKKQLFFVHLPSCGGTTLWSILRHYYGPENVLRFAGVPGDSEKYSDVRDSNPRYARLSVIGGHTGIVEAIERCPSRALITFMRDPIERVLSVYHRRIRNGRWHPDPALQDRDILRFCNPSNDVSSFSKYYSPAMSAEASLDDIKQMMTRHLAVVGLTSQFNVSLFLLADHLGWDAVPTYDRRNIGGNKPELPPTDVVEEMAGLLARDLEIYRHGVTLFDRARQALPSHVEEDLLPAYERSVVRREAALRADFAGGSPYVKTGE